MAVMAINKEEQQLFLFFLLKGKGIIVSKREIASSLPIRRQPAPRGNLCCFEFGNSDLT